MGHRAIVAYERTDGTYSLHYSHRGAFEYQLRETIGATNPFGECSNEIWATETIDLIRAGETIEQNPIKEKSGYTSVDPMPRGSADSLEEIANSYVNYLHYEAVYLVSMNWDVDVWVPLWAGLTYDCSRITNANVVGNRVLVRHVDQNPVCVDHRDLTTKWAVVKEVLGDGLDDNWISSDEASTYLRSKLEKWTRPNTDLLFSEDWSIGSMISD